jgi:hypothetical protein
VTTELPPGTLIDNRFVVEAVAGQGGMGTVYRALDQRTGQAVALKLLHPGGITQKESERFLREVRLLSELRHPGIVAYISHGRTEQDQPYLAMEWLEGEDFAQRLAQKRPTADECIQLTRKVAEALAEAHRHHIVHRDLKPSNIFLPQASLERIVLIDFGVARRVAHSREMTRTGFLIGTPDYMAPEQARGGRQIGPAADVFSLGCVLFECLTGKPPFVAEHLSAVLAKILFSEPPRLRTLRPDLPPALEELLARMLEKDPARRYADAASLARDLAALPPIIEGAAPPAPVAAADTSSFCSEQRLVCLLLAAEQDDRLSVAITLSENDPLVQQRHELLLSLGREFAIQGAPSAVLADGSLVVTLMTGAGTATDQAVQAAHCAAMIRHRWPAARIAVTTGRALVADQLPAGDALTRAGQMLQKATELKPATRAVLVDSVTAGLLGRRYRLQSLCPTISILLDDQDSEQDSPPVLGRATPFVGREQELAILESTFAACVEEETLRVVLVTGESGAGKSRLRQEFLTRLRDRGTAATLLIGRSELMTPRGSYALVRQVLRRLCGLGEEDAPEEQLAKLQRRIMPLLPEDHAQRISDFLAELCGLPRPDSASLLLRTARQDPRVMEDQLARAFADWVRAECAVQPVLMVLDDIHYADQASIGLIGSALRELRELRCMVIALARQDSDRAAPRLWSDHAFSLPLLPLSKRACERLITQVLGSDFPPAQAAWIVEQAVGNPLLLEELLHAAAHAQISTLPETVLAMVQARLERLDAASRRLVRAASIFGEQFWPQAVEEVLGGPPAGGLDEALAELVAHEVIVPRRESRFPGQPEYAFRYGLLRDAAYEMLSDNDRRAGHRAAVRWLERQEEQDASLLTYHTERGGRRP